MVQNRCTNEVVESVVKEESSDSADSITALSEGGERQSCNSVRTFIEQMSVGAAAQKMKEVEKQLNRENKCNKSVSVS